MDLSSSKDGQVSADEVQASESCGGQTTTEMAGCPNEPIKTGLSEPGPEGPVEAEDDIA